MHLILNNRKDFFLTDFGATIKDLRVGEKISRGSFGKSVGLSVFKVGQLEEGKLDIDLELFCAITKALLVTPSIFFEIEENS